MLWAQPVHSQGEVNIPESDSAASNITICEYDAASGVRSPLASTASLDGGAAITALEVGGNSIFIYEAFPDVVVLDNTPENPAINSDIAAKRMLTLYDMPLSIARARLSSQPAYYAELLGLPSVEALGDRSYAEVDNTLTCRVTTELPEGLVASTPDPDSDTASDSDTENTVQALPDGNYRFTSANLPFQVISPQALLESGGSVFLFKKIAHTVVGDCFYPETDIGICVTGSLSGSVVTGKGKLDGTEATAPDDDAFNAGRSVYGR